MDKSMPFNSDRLITHQTSNSQAAVRFEIRKQERVHWFLGLRQAELIVDAKQGVLDYNERQLRRGLRKVRQKQRQLDRLIVIQKLSLGLLPLQDAIESLQDDIAEAKQEYGKIHPYVRDALMERDTAAIERDRIIHEHEEELNTNFDELQEKYAQPAMLQGFARYFASRVWASQNHLPEALGSLLFELAPEERDWVMTNEMQLRLGVDVSGALAQASGTLASLPPEQQQQVLLQAARIVQEAYYPQGELANGQR